MSRAPVARRGRGTVTRSLERRLLALTSGLDHADVSEKGIDVVKELRELHALLRALQESDGGSDPPRPLEVRWLDGPPDDPSAAPSGAAPPPAAPPFPGPDP